MENKIIEELIETVKGIDESYYQGTALVLKRAHRVFVAGAGRSSLIGRCFAMRLMHLGLEIYAVGETICPAIKKGDLLISVSCSGDKKPLLELVRTAKKNGAKVLCITSKKDNPLTELSDYKVIIPVRKSIQFGNSLFEQSAFIFLETLVEYYRQKEKITISNMLKHHANLE
jgi:6-phospho-3-hexuloisomerase